MLTIKFRFRRAGQSPEEIYELLLRRLTGPSRVIKTAVSKANEARGNDDLYRKFPKIINWTGL